MRVVTVGERYPIPPILVDLNARRLDWLDVIDKMPGQRQRVGLDVGHASLEGERVHRVLLGVGGQHVRLIAAQVGVGELASQAGRDVQVADLMLRRIPIDTDKPRLGLAVLVIRQHVLHVSSRDRWSSRTN